MICVKQTSKPVYGWHWYIFKTKRNEIRAKAAKLYKKGAVFKNPG